MPDESSILFLHPAKAKLSYIPAQHELKAGSSFRSAESFSPVHTVIDLYAGQTTVSRGPSCPFTDLFGTGFKSSHYLTT